MHLKDKIGITDNGSAVSDVGSSPHHEVVIQSLFKLPKHFEFDPAYRYVSALPAQQVKSYSTMDVRLGWKFAEEFELSLVGQSLFQPNHQEFGTGVPNLSNIGIKRTAYLKIVWNR
jgi:iron complex outermembrane receptor protein